MSAAQDIERIHIFLFAYELCDDTLRQSDVDFDVRLGLGRATALPLDVGRVHDLLFRRVVFLFLTKRDLDGLGGGCLFTAALGRASRLRDLGSFRRNLCDLGLGLVLWRFGLRRGLWSGDLVEVNFEVHESRDRRGVLGWHAHLGERLVKVARKVEDVLGILDDVLGDDIAIDDFVRLSC